jgi:hypothetical protein
MIDIEMAASWVKDILSGHGMNEKTVDFGVLLNYDQILKI